MEQHAASKNSQTANPSNAAKRNHEPSVLSAGLTSAAPSGLYPAQLLQLQMKMGNQAVRQLMKSRIEKPATEQLKDKPLASNQTGMPDQLKQGIESLSGMSMDDVKVHYNSSKPSDVQAHAYAEGTDIHIGAGQEKHLSHEAWHVVQQKQGRVKPTLQTKGIAINDDKGLETEATVMGGRALQKGFSKETASRPESSTMQLKSIPAVKQLVADMYTTQGEYDTMLNSRFAIGKNVDWMPTVDNAYDHLEKVEKVLDDDDDAILLNDMEAEFDTIVEEIDDATRDFQELSNDNPDEVSSKRRRTKKGSVGTLQAKLDEIFSANKQIIQAYAIIKRTFPLNEGGFSAKGRAHEMDTENKAKRGYAEDNTWFEGIKLNGAKMDKKVYKAEKKVAEAASAPIINSDIDQKYADDDTKLLKLEKKLDTLVTNSGIITLKGAPAGRDRGKGQVSAMKGTNASGYAKLAKIPGYENTKWEWLHIRGASLGGATDGSNLVLGSRDVNTHMMPFESNIRTLGKIVSDHKDKFDSLKVTYTASGQGATAKHKVEGIKIKWELVKKSTAPASVKATKGEAVFKPLTGNASISKDEVAILEKALKSERDKIKE